MSRIMWSPNLDTMRVGPQDMLYVLTLLLAQLWCYTLEHVFVVFHEVVLKPSAKNRQRRGRPAQMNGPYHVFLS